MLLSCRPVRARLASRPGLLLLLEDGGDDDDGEAENQENGGHGIDPGLVVGNIDPQPSKTGPKLEHEEQGSVPEAAELGFGSAAAENDLLLRKTGEADEDLGDPGDLRKPVGDLGDSGDLNNADNDLQKPQIAGQKSVTGILLPINAEILFFGDALLRACAFDPEDVAAVACASVHEDACEDDADSAFGDADRAAPADDGVLCHASSDYATDGGDHSESVKDVFAPHHEAAISAVHAPVEFNENNDLSDADDEAVDGRDTAVDTTGLAFFGDVEADDGLIDSDFDEDAVPAYDAQSVNPDEDGVAAAYASHADAYAHPADADKPDAGEHAIEDADSAEDDFAADAADLDDEDGAAPDSDSDDGRDAHAAVASNSKDDAASYEASDVSDDDGVESVDVALVAADGEGVVNPAQQAKGDAFDYNSVEFALLLTRHAAVEDEAACFSFGVDVAGMHAALQEPLIACHVYDDAPTHLAKPRIDPKVKKKTSLLLCITINMPFHPGEKEAAAAEFCGASLGDYLFTLLWGSNCGQDREEQNVQIVLPAGSC